MTKTMKKAIAFILMICTLSASMISCSFFNGMWQENEEPFAGKLSEKATWLKEATSDNVVKAGVVTLLFGVAPGTLKDCHYSTEKSDITALISFYSNLEIEEVDPGVIEGMNGGGGLNIVLTYADGSTNILEYRHGYYVIGSEVFKATTEEKYDYQTTFDRYQRIEYEKLSYVYTNTEEPQLVGQTDSISDFRFRIIEAESDTYLTATHYIEMNIGKIYILSATTFYLYNQYGVSNYYELIEGQSFRDFITENAG